jgi:hypothetical protein
VDEIPHREVAPQAGKWKLVRAAPTLTRVFQSCTDFGGTVEPLPKRCAKEVPGIFSVAEHFTRRERFGVDEIRTIRIYDPIVT